MTESNSVAICVVGWHFPQEFFSSLVAIPAIDVFVVSHKKQNEIPAWMYSALPEGRVFCEPNTGYDWGAYQQFLEKGIWRNYNYLFFMHDDTIIRSPEFIEASIALLKNGKSVIGNGLNSSKTDWPETHTQCYAHSRWKPDSRGFRHLTVRGSYVACSRDALEALDGFEVFWDWLHTNIRFGNWSLIATCGKMAAILGTDCFGFLSEDYCASEYLQELERGKVENEDPGLVGPWKRRMLSAYSRLCTLYMSCYYLPARRLFCIPLRLAILLLARRSLIRRE